MAKIEPIVALTAAFILAPILGCASLFANPQPAATDTTPVAVAPVETAAVMPFGDTLFVVYGSMGGVSVEARAKIIADNIRQLKDDLLYSADMLDLRSGEDFCNVIYNNQILVGVTDRQSRMAGEPMQDMAQHYHDRIVAAVAKQKQAHSWFNIIKQTLLALLILAVVYFGVKYINLLYRKLTVYVRRRKLHLKSLLYLLDAGRQTKILCSFINALRWLLLLLFSYICLLLLFRLFPETRWISDKLISYILSPLTKALLAIWNFLPNLFAIIVIYFLFQLLLKALHIIADKLGSGAITLKNFEPSWATPTYQIVRVIVWVFMFIFIFPFLPQSDTDVFKGVSVFLGVLFSLGSTSIISNIVAGLIITYMRPFQEGDRIRMGEHLGDVVEKTALVTRLKTPKNEIITIPNANLLTAQTINYTASANDYGLILHVKVTMGYTEPWRRIHELLMEAGLKTPGVLQEPKPFVLQVALDDFCVEYQINVYTRQANNMQNIYSDLYSNVQDILLREGINMAVPHQIVVNSE
ncbi:MAG: mechanosensitive ion channel family protein [Prevotellaceae bacterium]|jgi:small-conductance mechanosensitive channel|nr:mechanosensitive ion channel family protein [Prevotellaceae bacterium]